MKQRTWSSVVVLLTVIILGFALTGCASNFSLYDAEAVCESGKIQKYEHRTHREVKRLECR